MSWWRKNALALGALVLAASLTGISWYVGVWLPLSPPEAAVATPDDEGRGTLGGATFDDLTIASEEDPEGYYGAPDGTWVVAVSVDVSPQESGLSCSLQLSESDGEQRTWTPTSVISPFAESDDPSYCTGTGTEDYRVLTAFLLPDDARGPFVLDIVSGSDVLRLPVVLP